MDGLVKTVYEKENFYHLVLKSNSTQIDSEEAAEHQNEFKLAKVDKYL